MHVCVCHHYPFIPWPHISPPSFNSAIISLSSPCLLQQRSPGWDWTLNSRLLLCVFTQKMITASHSPATDKHQHYNKKEVVLVCGETRPPSGTNISEWKSGVSYRYLCMWYDLQRKGSSAPSIQTHQRCDSNRRTLKRKIEPAVCQQPQRVLRIPIHPFWLFLRALL